MNRKILCAADFGQASGWAVRHATEVARAAGDELLLCHFVESPYRYAREFVYAEPGSEAEAVMGPEVERRYAERLEALCEDRLDGRVRFIVSNGAPEIEILRLARREKVDLIVIGQGEATATRVLGRARCPVMVATGPHSFILTGTGAPSWRMAAAA